jgi:hypothetical protein
VEEGEQTRVGKGCQDSSIVTGKSLIVFSIKIVKKLEFFGFMLEFLTWVDYVI